MSRSTRTRDWSSTTTYYYKVSSYNSGGETFSAVASGLTSTPLPAAPSSPSGVNFTGISTTGMTVTWNDTSSNESGFHVYRSTDGVNFAVAATLGANVTSFGDSGLTAGTTYYYKVSAYNAGGENFSPMATSATLPLAPSSPTGINFTGISMTGITVNWTDASSNEIGFRVYRSTDGTNFAVVASLGANVTSFGDSGLTAGTTYYYKVSSYNAGGETVSTAASVATSSPPPALRFNQQPDGDQLYEHYHDESDGHVE